jgi:hypothetical protein
VALSVAAMEKVRSAVVNRAGLTGGRLV